MNQNITELNLLKSDPKALIVLYQDIIEIIINRFIKSGGINISDKEDFIQVINERLLLSIDKIKNQYKGISLLKTYFSTIIRNICLEEINKRNRYETVELESKNLSQATTDTDESYLKIEYDRLEKALLMYNTKEAKLTFCLKVIYRLKTRITDFTKYCLKFKPKEIKILLEEIHYQKSIPEYELFKTITPYINKCDAQENKPDALRRWVKRKIDEIIELMNGRPKRANYDKETIQILVEKYYSK